MIYAVDVACVIISIVADVSRGGKPSYWACLAATSALAAAGWALAGVRDGVVLMGLSAMFALLMWWWRRRKDRRRLSALLSGKYRHVRDAMARTMRDRRVARPALAPGRA